MWPGRSRRTPWTHAVQWWAQRWCCKSNVVMNLQTHAVTYPRAMWVCLVASGGCLILHRLVFLGLREWLLRLVVYLVAKLAMFALAWLSAADTQPGLVIDAVSTRAWGPLVLSRTGVWCCVGRFSTHHLHALHAWAVCMLHYTFVGAAAGFACVPLGRGLSAPCSSRWPTSSLAALSVAVLSGVHSTALRCGGLHLALSIELAA